MISRCLSVILMMETLLFWVSPARAVGNLGQAWVENCLSPYLDKGPEMVSAVPWEACIGPVPDRTIHYFLTHGLYQEAVWFLEEDGRQQQADYVHWFLSYLMNRSVITKKMVSKLGMGGATKPKAVDLPLGVRGVFKKKKSMHPSSDYRSEIAAYVFDRVYGFRLVPMTVQREISGKIGSVQYFIKGATPVRKIPDYQRSCNLNVFDYLISNKDRNGNNILFAWSREIGIDHGLSLRGSNILGRILKGTDKVNNSFGIVTHPVRQVIVHPTTHIARFRASDHIIKNLENVTYQELKKFLGDLISESKIDRIFDKKIRLLENLRQASLIN